MAGVLVQSAHFVICTTQPSANCDNSTSLLHLEQTEETVKLHLAHDIVWTFSIIVSMLIITYIIHL